MGPSVADRLEAFTTDELLSEVGRRARALKEAVDGVTLCQGCTHVVYWTKRGEPPDSFNSCGLKHALEFRMPDDDDPHADNCGFYRPGGCPDRREAPPPPLPAIEPIKDEHMLDRPWRVKVDGTFLRDKAGRFRWFGSCEGAQQAGYEAAQTSIAV